MRRSNTWKWGVATIAGAGLFALLSMAAPAEHGWPPIRIDYLPKDPLLIYDLSGSTLLGTVHCELAIYDDGSVNYVELDPVDAPQGRVAVMKLPEPVIRRFLDELILFNAATLADGTRLVMDVPMATLTMLFKDPFEDSTAHTFSYYPAAAVGDAARVDATVQAFIAQHFPTWEDGWVDTDPVRR